MMFESEINTFIESISGGLQLSTEEIETIKGNLAALCNFVYDQGKLKGWNENNHYMRNNSVEFANEHKYE